MRAVTRRRRFPAWRIVEQRWSGYPDLDMTEIEETPLPGVGVRHDFSTKSGSRVGVVSHRTGCRELVLYSEDDPDACETTLRLEEEDVRVLADLIGAAHVTESLAKHIQHEVEGLAMSWLRVSPDSPCAGATLAEIGLRTHTGISVVAVIRDGATTPSPGAEFVLAGEDTAVVVGTTEGIRRATELFQPPLDQ